MRNLLLIFSLAFLTGYIFTEATAMQSPKVDEFDLLMQRIQRNLKEASAVTQEAQKMSAKLVEKKVEEKKTKEPIAGKKGAAARWAKHRAEKLAKE